MSVDFKIVLNITHLGSVKLVSVDNKTSFNEVVGYIVGNWPELGQVGFNATCVVGDVSNICFNSQNDLDSVLLMCEVSCTRVVLVVIVGVTLVSSTAEEGNELSRLSSDWRFDSVNRGVKRNLLQMYKTTTNVGVRHEPHTQISNVDDADDNEKISHEPCSVYGQSLLSDGWEVLVKGGSGHVFFGTAVEFRVALIKFATKVGFKFKYARNTLDIIHDVCSENSVPNCGWYIKAMKNSMQYSYTVDVSTDIHLCVQNSLSSLEVGKMSAAIIGDLMIPNAKNNSRFSGKDVIHAMKITYGIEVPYSKAKRAAEFAKLKLFGKFSESYDQVKYYCDALQITNPGSVALVEVCKKSNRFDRLFISLFASIKGFQFCPPLIFLDGTFLRGPCGGILLVVIAKDGNQGLFPLAFGVVSVENTSNWSWFLRMIRQHISHPQTISYLSDRNSGLMAAFNETFDKPVHFFCIFHLLANLKTRFCGGVKKSNRFRYVQLFKDCAYEVNQLKFYDKIKEFHAIGGKKAEEWLLQLPFHKWSLSFSPQVIRFGELTSNAAESFNSWILPARALPITKMVDYIRSGLSKWFVQRRKESSKWTGTLVPKKELLWSKISNIGCTWNVVVCPGNDYEVLSSPSTRVDLMSRTCSCHEWQSSGFPCCHAATVICKVRCNLSLDVEPYFLTVNYQQSYGWDINPVPETLLVDLQSTPSVTKIMSPIIKRPVGRPKSKKRFPSVGEYKKNTRTEKVCSKCWQMTNHDEWSCAA